MSDSTNYYKIGLFVIFGIVLLVAGLLAFTSHLLWQHNTYYETYFSESVDGLEVGTPVKFRGVNVGSITEISFVGNVYPKLAKEGGINNQYARYIYVKMALDLPFMKDLNQQQAIMRLHEAIQQGLRIRITPSGLTGNAYLELNYYQTPLKTTLRVVWKPKEFYIPSSPSTFTQLREIFDEIHQAGLPQMFHNLDKLIKNADRTITRGKFDVVGQKASVALTSITKTSNKLNYVLTDFEKTAKMLPQTMNALKQTLNKTNIIVASQQQQLQDTLDNFQIMSENLRALSANLKQYPSQAIFSKAPRRVPTK